VKGEKQGGPDNLAITVGRKAEKRGQKHITASEEQERSFLSFPKDKKY